MKERLFRFKRFSVHHSRSAMPIGVDGVLIGAWTPVAGKRMLDVGTGCGVIAMMLAQRNPGAMVLGIDNHHPSVEECTLNFEAFPIPGSLKAIHLDFPEEASRLCESGRFDVIVSNPPFYESGVDSPDTARLKARHASSLSPISLLENAPAMLNDGGCLSMIVPVESFEKLVRHGEKNGMELSRSCFVRDHSGSPLKRAMLEFRCMPNDDASHQSSPPEPEELTMFEPDGTPTPEYRQLCADFYLKF